MIELVAEYTGGTSRFWRYEAITDEGIFKFWIPHTKYEKGKRVSQRPPNGELFLVHFRRETPVRKVLGHGDGSAAG